MPLDLNAEVRMFFIGLALCCYNKSEGRWEIAFPQSDDHQLKITINQTQKVAVRAGQKIRITTENTVEFPQPYYQGRNGFAWGNRRLNDPKDFRYFVDLEDRFLTHSFGVERKRSSSSVISLSIANAIFYAEELSELDYVLINTALPGLAFRLGKVGHLAGAEIKFAGSSGGNVIFGIEGETPISLPQGANTKYEIMFDNHCHDQCRRLNDFELYYDVVKPKFDLGRYTLDLTEGSKKRYEKFDRSKRARIDCDPAQASQMDTLI